MKKALVCSKWELPFIDGEGGFFHYLNNIGGRHSRCLEMLLEGLPGNVSVVEHFAGVGILTTIIRELIKPSSHVAYEIDNDCLAQVKYAFPDVETSYGDAAETIGLERYDIVFLDFPNLTALRLPNWHDQFKRMFETKPMFVELTDVAFRRLYMNKKIYSNWFGEPILTGPDYIRAVSKYIYRLYGYSICKAVYQQEAIYMLFAPGDNEEFEIPFIRDDGTGFKLQEY